jgi:predicted GNAT family acetyltransferase
MSKFVRKNFSMDNFSNNGAKHRYELTTEGHLSIIEYMIAANDVYLTHTEVPPALEGRGIGSRIVGLALEDIRSRNMKMVPLCPFVAAYIKRHKEWNDMVKDGFKVN